MITVWDRVVSDNTSNIGSADILGFAAVVALALRILYIEWLPFGLQFAQLESHLCWVLRTELQIIKVWNHLVVICGTLQKGRKRSAGSRLWLGVSGYERIHAINDASFHRVCWRQARGWIPSARWRYCPNLLGIFSCLYNDLIISSSVYDKNESTVTIYCLFLSFHKDFYHFSSLCDECNMNMKR